MHVPPLRDWFSSSNPLLLPTRKGKQNAVFTRLQNASKKSEFCFTHLLPLLVSFARTKGWGHVQFGKESFFSVEFLSVTNLTL